MHMGTMIGPLEYAGYQYIAQAQGGATDGTASFHVPVNTVPTAAYMH
jgi:hypothetical protein